MPLARGKSKKTMSKNIREMIKSPTFGAGKTAQKRQKMAVAAAYSKARGKGR